mmetsp:Transcript_79243/g.201674  ORF Transcript_79243/g.201674 Transcript_79243/m.201674 type:complete len:222 (-) Transcript_79243:571-1236(-)
MHPAHGPCGRKAHLPAGGGAALDICATCRPCFRPSSRASSRSAISSLSASFNLSLVSFPTTKPPAMCQRPRPSHTTGIEKISPPAMPYSLPSDQTPMDEKIPGLVPQCKSRMCPTMARAADSAHVAFRALWMLAPRCSTSGASSCSSHFLSSSLYRAEKSGLPLTVHVSKSALRAEGLAPQTATFLTSSALAEARWAICPATRFCSSRESPKKLSFGREGA